MSKNNKRSFLSIQWVHWLVVILSILFTIFVWRYTDQKTNQLNIKKFQREAAQTVQLIQGRMSKYVDALYGGVAYLSAEQNEVSHHEWRHFADTLMLEKKYPGINGIGVIYIVKPNGKLKFLGAQKASGNDFSIYPKHNRDVLLPITYIEPIEANRKALGLDVAHEQNRYDAAMLSAKTGKPAVTGPIVLVQDKKKTPGFLLYIPLYQEDVSDVVLIPKKLIGFVYAPFIMKKLMDGALSEESRYLNVKISDGNDILFADQKKVSTFPGYELVKNVNMYGRNWTFEVTPTDRFSQSIDGSLPHYILIAGVIINIALILIFFILGRSHQRAVEYAKTLTKDLSQLANHDYLTSLPNRMSFVGQLMAHVERGNAMELGVLYLDVDDFKKINDGLGHSVGDILLVQVGLRLQELLNEKLPGKGIVARFGGDEFSMLLCSQHIEKDCIMIAKAIMQSNEEAYIVQGHTFHVQMSIGMAFAHYFSELESDGENLSSHLLKNSDIAMYEAKNKGKNQYQIFDEVLLAKTQRQNILELDVQNAIELNQFFMEYQPIYSGETLEVYGYEALLRWRHPIYGLISPMEFIPTCEKTGYIVKLGYHILESVFKQIKALRDEQNEGADKIFTINCSPIQFEDRDFLRNLKKLIRKYDINVSQIVLEVTETAVMKDIKETIKILRKIKSKGINIAIDDFGTGYSSLNYLELLPVKYIKIDKLFVDRISKEGNEMVCNIIQISHSCGMKLIAEGVEVKLQQDYLIQHKCDYLQGYYLGKPKPFS